MLLVDAGHCWRWYLCYVDWILIEEGSAAEGQKDLEGRTEEWIAGGKDNCICKGQIRYQ